MKVSQVMSKAVVIEDSISLRKAANIMSRKNIANVVVVSGGKIKGFVSERDVLNNLSKLDKPVKGSMTRGVITISSESDVVEAGRIMVSRKVKRLPVIKNKKLVGAISFRDVIKHAKSSGSSSDEGDFFFN